MLNRIFQHLEWKKLRVILEYAVYMMLVMLLQSLLFSKISIFGAKGFIIPAAAVAAGIYLGGVRGAVFGIFLGLFTDMSFPETTVLFTVLFPMIGFGAGLASEFYINKSFFAFMIFSTAAILLTGLSYQEELRSLPALSQCCCRRCFRYCLSCCFICRSETAKA